MGQCGGPQQAGNHPIPGLQAWRAAPLGTADRPGQAWLGLWAPAHAALDSFFFLLIYPATPLRTAARHSRFHRSFLFFEPVFCMAKKKRCPTPRKSISCFAHILQNPVAKTRTCENFLIFARAQEVTPLRQIASLTWSHRGAPFFPSPSYILRHHFARRHVTAGSAAAFQLRAPRTQTHPGVDSITTHGRRTRGPIAAEAMPRWSPQSIGQYRNIG